MHTPITFQNPAGKSLATLTVHTLEDIHNDRDYKLFYESVEKSAGKIKAVSKPTLPQKRNIKLQYPSVCRGPQI